MFILEITYDTIIAAVITGTFAYFVNNYLISKGILLETSNNRFYKAYNPLFKQIELTLYKKISIDDARNNAKIFSNILDEYYELLSPPLASEIKIFLFNIDFGYVKQKNYRRICSLIDVESDILRKRLKLPRRSLWYTYKHNQLPSVLKYFFKYYAIALMIYISYVIITLAIFMFTHILKP